MLDGKYYENPTNVKHQSLSDLSRHVFNKLLEILILKWVFMKNERG